MESVTLAEFLAVSYGCGYGCGVIRMLRKYYEEDTHER